ncbi:MAG TPA: hypothetical protein VJ302_00075 [Blastocatellia bacterium]|nr:hypothetical protein [Blastocatellia bacterium]
MMKLSQAVAILCRDHKFFDPNFTDDYFMDAYNVAVKIGEPWRFFDPAHLYAPFGMLRWQEEGSRP